MKKKVFSLALVILLLIPNFVFAQNNDTPADEVSWDEEIIYFLLTDRFFDGDESNNNPNNVEGSYDPDHLEAYHGGDFRGIIDKIDYLKDLGITTIWITPIVKNIESNMRASLGEKQFGYHGYWAEDFTKIDPHLGTEEDLKELIDVLHDNGIKLMVDVVLNHSGYGTEKLPQFEGMIRENPGGGDITMALSGLPDFKTEEEEVRKQIIEWQTDWIKNLKTEKGNSIDYFRVDTVKHVEPETWKDFKSAIIEIDPTFKLIGEQFGGSIFNDGGYLDPSMMDSLLDFEFKDLARDFTRGRIEEAEAKLVRRNQAITEDRQMGQFLSSHDEHGFLKMKLRDNIPQYLVAVSLQLTAKGQPVIYYGEEIGMSGKKDNFDKGEFSENRHSFKWEDVENNNIRAHYQNLIKIRKDYKEVFAKGDRENIFMDDNVSVFARNYDGKTVYVALNTSEETQEISFPVNESESLTNLYDKTSIKNNGGNISLTIPANSEGGTAILVSNSNLVEGYKEAVSFVPYIGVGLFVIAFIVFIILKRKNQPK